MAILGKTNKSGEIMHIIPQTEEPLTPARPNRGRMSVTARQARNARDFWAAVNAELQAERAVWQAGIDLETVRQTAREEMHLRIAEARARQQVRWEEIRLTHMEARRKALDANRQEWADMQARKALQEEQEIAAAAEALHITFEEARAIRQQKTRPSADRSYEPVFETEFDYGQDHSRR